MSSGFRFTRGPKILVEALNRILDIQEGHKIVPGSTVTMTRSPGGTLLDVNVQSIAGTSPHPWLPIDASGALAGASPAVSVTAASLTDLTNSGTVWDGTTGNIIYINDYLNGNVPFALAITGPPARQPILQLDPGATCVYLDMTVDSSTGFITAGTILGDTGSGVPTSTDTDCYILLSTITINFNSMTSTYSVTVNNDGAQSNLFFKSCEGTPLTDGNGFVIGT